MEGLGTGDKEGDVSWIGSGTEDSGGGIVVDVTLVVLRCALLCPSRFAGP